MIKDISNDHFCLGISGLFVGSFAGVVRSSTPKLFALASGIQWFTLGTTFAGMSSNHKYLSLSGFDTDIRQLPEELSSMNGRRGLSRHETRFQPVQ